MDASQDFDILDLSTGIDLKSQITKPVVGGLVSSVNREVVDGFGLSRIDGFSRYDGAAPVVSNDYRRIECHNISGLVPLPDSLKVLPAPLLLNGEVVGIIVKVETHITANVIVVWYKEINTGRVPEAGDIVTGYDGSGPDPLAVIEIDRPVTSLFKDSQKPTNEGGQNFTAKQVIELHNELEQVLRSAVEAPGQGTRGATISATTPVGLHWFRDRLYSVVDDSRLLLYGSTVVRPGMFIGLAPGMIWKVLDVQATDGSLSDPNAWMVLHVEGSVDPFTIAGTAVLYDSYEDVSSGTSIGFLFAVDNRAVCNGYTTVTGVEIRPGDTVIDEDNGGPARVVEEVTLLGGEWGDLGTSFAVVLSGSPATLTSANYSWYSASTGLTTSPAVVLSPTPSVGYDDKAAGYKAMASVYEGLRTDQAFNENKEPGWVRIDSGYEAEYKTGTSFKEGITTVTRGSKNNFTATTGDKDGLSRFVFNGTNLIDEPFAPLSRPSQHTAQVSLGYPGWKASTDTTQFASYDALLAVLSGTGSGTAYANVWYWGEAGVPGQGLGTAGRLAADDKGIAGPAPYKAGPASVGSTTIDADWYSTQARAPIVLTDLFDIASDIPDGAVVTGMEVTVNYKTTMYAQGAFVPDRNGAGGSSFGTNTTAWIAGSTQFAAKLCKQTDAPLSSEGLGSTQYAPVSVPSTGDLDANLVGTVDVCRYAAVGTDTSAVIGGSSNNWGNENLSRSDLMDPRLGIALFAQVTSDPVYPIGMQNVGDLYNSREYVEAGLRIYIDSVNVKIHYTTPAARYFVTDNGTDVCSVDITYYYTKDGSWKAGTASGGVQYTNLRRDIVGDKHFIDVGDKFYTSQADAVAQTNPVLEVAGVPRYNGLPGLNQLIDNQSRYSFVTANYFGRDDWDGVYGVSGAGRAFSLSVYDADNDGSMEKYLINITTNTAEDIEEDKPRHVAFFQNTLALGYSSGIVRFSVAGEPENFDGTAGAAEIGVGDRVTGLLPLRGTTLAVYGENSIRAVVGAYADQFALETLSPDIGAIEYTCVNSGVPIHCDQRGISTLEQSEKYGNWAGVRLSSRITPWLQRRLYRETSYVGGVGIVCAYPVRAKNQYRLHFSDGEVLSMSINPDQAPSFTTSMYTVGGDDGAFFVPLAVSCEADEEGAERVHMSHYAPTSRVPAYESSLVYEFEKGWSFDGHFIPNSYSLNWYSRNPFVSTKVQNVALDGLSRGVSFADIYAARDYNMVASQVVKYAPRPVDISFPFPKPGVIYEDYVPACKDSSVPETGKVVSFKVAARDEWGVGGMPPDIHQALLVQTSLGGKIRV